MNKLSAAENDATDDQSYKYFVICVTPLKLLSVQLSNLVYSEKLYYDCIFSNSCTVLLLDLNCVLHVLTISRHSISDV